MALAFAVETVRLLAVHGALETVVHENVRRTELRPTVTVLGQITETGRLATDLAILQLVQLAGGQITAGARRTGGVHGELAGLEIATCVVLAAAGVALFVVLQNAIATSGGQALLGQVLQAAVHSVHVDILETLDRTVRPVAWRQRAGAGRHDAFALRASANSMIFRVVRGVVFACNWERIVVLGSESLD